MKDNSHNFFLKNDLIRLIITSLDNCGYSSSARFLEKDAGVQLSSPILIDLFTTILNGEWEKSYSFLKSIKMRNENGLNKANFLIKRHKYLEMIEQQDYHEAVQCLRQEVAPLCSDNSDLYSLSALLLCKDKDSFRIAVKWSEETENSREILLNQIQDLICPADLVPKARLEELVCQAMEYQKQQNIYYNIPLSELSIYDSFRYTRPKLPNTTIQILEEHSDEVWIVNFSNNGEFLASASNDKRILLWKNTLDLWKQKHVLLGHTQPCSAIEWSPDDQYLLSCSSDTLIKLWNVQTGNCIRTYENHIDKVLGIAWMPNGEQFVSGGLDKFMYIWSIDGSVVREYGGYRFNSLCIQDNGNTILAVCSECEVRAFSVMDGVSNLVVKDKSIMSISLAKDQEHILLISSHQGDISCYDMQLHRIIARYNGHKQGRYVVNATFGGILDTFCVSGSEDSKVYIWRRSNGTLLEALEGHSGTVNSVSWNPKNPHLLASGSDDHTIRIWSYKEKHLKK